MAIRASRVYCILILGGNGPKYMDLDLHEDLAEDGSSLAGTGGKSHYHNTRHHHKKTQIRPGHDIDQNSLVGCLGDNCEEEFGEPPKQTRTSVAVMPKVGSE